MYGISMILYTSLITFLMIIAMYFRSSNFDQFMIKWKGRSMQILSKILQAEKEFSSGSK